MFERIVPSCEYLALVPRPEKLPTVKAHHFEATAPDNDSEERIGYFKRLMDEFYSPMCKKKDCHCIVLESVAMSMHTDSNCYQPFSTTMINIDRIKDCGDRKPEILDEELIDTFLLKHIKLD